MPVDGDVVGQRRRRNRQCHPQHKNGRGNASLSLAPNAGDTHWTVKSSWPSPSFVGKFIPNSAPSVTDKGFDADYRIGNLALGTHTITAVGIDSAGLAATLRGSKSITVTQ